MKLSTLFASVAARSIFAAAILFAAPAFSQTPSGDAFPNKSITIYVADFDIGANGLPGLAPSIPIRSAVPLNAQPVPSPAAPTTPAAPDQQLSGSGSTAASSTANPSPGAAPSSSDADKPDAQKPPAARTTGQTADAQNLDSTKPKTPVDNSPPAVAGRLLELTTTNFVRALEHAGYNVRRLRNPASPPENGILVRGVFAQADPSAGLRRVVIGGVATDPQMLLFVGIGNLSRPEQALYQVAGPPPSGTIGPLVSISAYAPITRYALERDPSEDALKRTAEQFTVDLTKVLNANPLAVSQP